MQNQNNIRSYTITDYESVKQLLADGGLYYEPFDSPERLSEKISKDPRSILVATEAERIVGTVRLLEDGSMAFIFRLAVNPEYRNRGIGRALMEGAERELFRRGYTELNILVEEENPGLHEYYEHQGYEKGNLYRWMTKERK
ncbi:GNAT family N-acetyltransferase [Candidatus Daviesbacteria bacterium]|nr:GNAT family N-acetyltransferase [Candidatus Daviesbacteria bacterium]